jgi:hypothetical protein
MTETVIPRPINYAALKTEIALPAYNGMTDVQAIAAVNVKVILSPIAGQVMVKVSDIVNCFDPTEFAALTSLQLQKLTLLLQGPTVDASKTTGANMRLNVAAIFPAAGPTRIALKALTDAADAKTVMWVQSILGVPAITQADLDNARAA